MMTARETIFVLLASNAGAELGDFAARGPVWMTQSPHNRAAAEAHWKREDANAHPVTIWSEPRSGESEEEWLDILDDIELHHSEDWSGPGIEAIEVHGAPLTDHARAALRELGYEVVETRADGFRAQRGV